MPNPLFSVSTTTDLGQIQVEHIEPAIRELVRAARAGLDAIAETERPNTSTIPGKTVPLTYEATLGALERVTEPLEHAMAVIEHLESVATTRELRSAYNAILPEVSEFWSSIPLHAGLYHALCAFSETAEARALEGPRRRFLDKTLSELRRNGAELPREKKAELSLLDQKLSELTNRFSQNVLDATNAFELVVEDIRALSGLPESALAEARHSAEGKGKAGYRFTLQTPSVIALLTYADRRDLREKIWRAQMERATDGEFDNCALIVEILKLRQARARLLGFRHFADLVTEDRMAKTGAEAARFVEELRFKTEAAFERENSELEAFARTLRGHDPGPLEPWDLAYYAEKQRRAHYDFDEEALRAYFSADDVLGGAFELAARLYGVSIVPDVERRAWDERVRTYRLLTADGGVAGIFYVDLYHRENKRGGAWMHGLISAVPPEPHLALLCTNLAPPLDDRPSLLTHREVETLFHEFGHLLHHCLSRVAVRSLSGTRVAHDFVELPSQILENWCSEREGLGLFARHYEGGAALPVELFERLKRVRTYRAANDQMRQLGFAAVDLALHMTYDPESDEDVLDYVRRVMQPYAPVHLPPTYRMAAQFTHLFGYPVGYAAGYYAYKWAEVLDADAFERFKHEGVFSRKVGQEFYDHILSRGDSEEPALLFERFRGRTPRLGALLERLGLEEPVTQGLC